MIYTPELPTTAELAADYPLDRNSQLTIAASRIAINAAITRPDNRYLLVGPCALTEDLDSLDEENLEWNLFAAENGLVAAMRRHPWKPRSVEGWEAKMAQWHGLETGYEDNGGDPSEATRSAYEIMHHGARTYGNISMEMAFDEHILRYGPMVSFAQIGARTPSHYYDNDQGTYNQFLDLLARREPTLPVGVKNDTDGGLERAIRDVNRVNNIRSGLGFSAISRAVLIYRGGTNAKTPDAWEAGAIDAIERTNGAVILDTAHGGEQAFDPDGKYGKSESGQLLCLEKAVELQQRGYRYSGLAIESSNIPSPMDPPAAVEAVKMRLKAMQDVMAA